MDIRSRIERRLKQKGCVRVSDIVQETGFSRAYINRFFQVLRRDGHVELVGKANRAMYIPKQGGDTRSMALVFQALLTNKNLSEDQVFRDIKLTTGIFHRLPQRVAAITGYAFTEMLNNAIEHSRSKKIHVRMTRTPENILFEVRDWGVGIFRNLMKRKGLKNEWEAVQELIKGKQTTMPHAHTGEGIFFTSKVADRLTIHGSDKKIIFDALADDVFVKGAPAAAGTHVSFALGIRSRRTLQQVFKEYTDRGFEFSKTKVVVKLFQIDTEYLSRSQARRVVSGLERFKTIFLDFHSVETVGQAFADEVFRVWQASHPNIRMIPIRMSPHVAFMIHRALRSHRR